MTYFKGIRWLLCLLFLFSMHSCSDDEMDEEVNLPDNLEDSIPDDNVDSEDPEEELPVVGMVEFLSHSNN